MVPTSSGAKNKGLTRYWCGLAVSPDTHLGEGGGVCVGDGGSGNWGCGGGGGHSLRCLVPGGFMWVCLFVVLV